LLYPSIIIDIVDVLHKKLDLFQNIRSVKNIFYGSSPINTNKLIEAVEKLGPIFIQAYGMTETLPPVSILSKEGHARAYHTPKRSLFSSCGKIVKGVSVKILDDLGNEVPEGDIGEVCIYGENVMKGYYGKEVETEQFIINGWAHTGDLGYIKDGYLFLIDRKKDLIIRRGQNIYPAEIEKVICSIHGVKECAVFSVPDASEGEIPYCAIAFHDTSTLEIHEVKSSLYVHLAEYKVPVEFTIVDQLPRNPNGKVDKKTLKAPYWQQAGGRGIN
jgi:fatty-acyl-CoA synthase/long-chain acyl-CoA synthetase